MTKPAREFVRRLEDLPNIGKACAADLRLLGVHSPTQLTGRDPYRMYQDLCEITQVRHDPCMIDTFISVVRFMDGAPALPWWHYTEERKRTLGLKK
jgi:hypothetical protein